MEENELFNAGRGSVFAAEAQLQVEVNALVGHQMEP
ncbi:hypothetical protein [Spirosoma fluviale]|nr:hypothetical protein [Spirosoma fluviale]